MPNSPDAAPTAEHRRLLEVRGHERDATGWRAWGPYVSDRSWATVREDYSEDGEAWDFLPHDLARSKAYRWGEDAIAGFCDRHQILVFAPAFWNGRDPILKERLFGLVPDEGNHGEDVKEYYVHVDNTPTHSYMSFLYRYPHAEYPYDDLIHTNRERAGQGPEYELVDTGVFDQNRFFDIVIEYAKIDEHDLAIRLTAHNRGPEPATVHLLPHLWYRNTWSWGHDPSPVLPQVRLLDPAPDGSLTLLADDTGASIPPRAPRRVPLGPLALYASPGGRALFTDNETNADRVPNCPRHAPFAKDAFHRQVISDEPACRPDGFGTRAAIHYHFPAVPAGGSVTVLARLTYRMDLARPLDDVAPAIDLRRAEADDFYTHIHPTDATDDDRLVQRRAFAGLLWTKQSYLFDVHLWLAGEDAAHRPPDSRWHIRNEHWLHLNSHRVMSVCDKWEYPWFAAWDLAFHTVPFALIDPQYAKDQLWLLLFEQFQHPNGQLPAYEWEFSDMNPPVHAWAVWRVYHMDADFHRRHHGEAKKDRDFLERCFHKLLINFAWWVNKVDRAGNNIFEGGFLGLDNITVVDRSRRCEDGSVLEQADGTGWMGMFCLNLMRIALELAQENPVYEAMATKFFQHYAYVASAMKHMGGRDYALWDEEDGFFYDVLRRPDGSFQKLRVRSVVGLIPLFAVERLETDWIERFPLFRAQFEWFLTHRRDLVQDVVHPALDDNGDIRTHVLTIVDREQLHRILLRLLDPDEFLSGHGVRSLSRAHLAEPFVYDGREVSYEPAESITKLKGGNSNWRGPVWFPINFLLIESLRKLGKAWGAPDGFHHDPNEPRIPFRDVAHDVARRLISLFTLSPDGRRPHLGLPAEFQRDPLWRDHPLFFEFFHGDDGTGLGASHQTGWTALVASLIDEWCEHAAPASPTLPEGNASAPDTAPDFGDTVGVTPGDSIP